MATIASLIVEISAKSIKLKSGLTKASSKIKAFAKSSAKVLAGIGAAVGVGVVAGIAAITATVNKYAQKIDEMAKFSTKFGLTVKALQELHFMAELTGVSFSTMNMSIQKMVRSTSEAAQGIGQAKEELKELGLNAKYLNQLKPEQQFIAISEAMKGIVNQNDKVRLAVAIFGRSGTDVLNTMAGDLKGMKAEFETLGVAVSQSSARMVEAYNDSKTKLGTIFSGFGIQLTAQLAAPFKKIIDWMADVAKEAGGLDKIAKYVASSLIDGIASVIEAGAGLFNFFKDIKIGLLEIKLKAQEALKAITFINAAEIGGKLFDKDFKINIFGDTSKTEKDIKELEKSVKNTSDFSEKARKIAQDLRGSVGKGVEGAASKAGRVYSNSASKVQSLADAADKAARALTPKQGTKKERGNVTDLGDMSSRIKAQQVYKNAAQNMQDNAGLSGFGKALDGMKSNAGNVRSIQDHIDASQAGKALQEMRKGLFGRNSGTSLSDVSSPDSAEANGKFYTGESLKKVMKQDSATRIMEVRDLNKPKNSIMIDLKTDYGEVAGRVLVNDEFVAGLKRLQNKNTNEAARMAAV